RAIEVEDLTKHKMDSEQMELTEKNATFINNTKLADKKVCVVGTTTMKAIETAATIGGKVKPYAGWTNKFIFPNYDFQVADAMITNFHKPLSSMLIMACAFGGFDLIMKAYEEALNWKGPKGEKYRFLTYGDAMLII
ncbi:MAG: S-adenosylmethionine:tRNA ribosyltransferase-isomerase, partial [Bacteroidales bacterium]|nr:S-adenosylmethionine:tRNA ribosyltransferase-isomerase [Bacteroidales bacterium]